MKNQRVPRYQGKIASWNDAQGFGFITPNGGGEKIFVHIKSFGERRSRPADGDGVTFELASNERGQPRAEKVAFVGDPRPIRSSKSSGMTSLVVAVGFLALIAIAALSDVLPRLLLGVYYGSSALAFIAYAIDKSAARNNQWRTKEDTLHLLGLVGGWPGALIARQLFRHKSTKQSFRTMLWVTVVLNCAALLWLMSPYGTQLLMLLMSV